MSESNGSNQKMSNGRFSKSGFLRVAPPIKGDAKSYLVFGGGGVDVLLKNQMYAQNRSLHKCLMGSEDLERLEGCQTAIDHFYKIGLLTRHIKSLLLSVPDLILSVSDLNRGVRPLTCRPTLDLQFIADSEWLIREVFLGKSTTR